MGFQWFLKCKGSFFSEIFSKNMTDLGKVIRNFLTALSAVRLSMR